MRVSTCDSTVNEFRIWLSDQSLGIHEGNFKLGSRDKPDTLKGFRLL